MLFTSKEKCVRSVALTDLYSGPGQLTGPVQPFAIILALFLVGMTLSNCLFVLHVCFIGSFKNNVIIY